MAALGPIDSACSTLAAESATRGSPCAPAAPADVARRKRAEVLQEAPDHSNRAIDLQDHLDRSSQKDISHASAVTSFHSAATRGSVSALDGAAI